MPVFRFRASAFFIHLIGWLLFLGFPLLFLNREQANFNSWLLLLSPYYWLFCLTYLVLFYLNAWYLVPTLVFRRRYLLYGVIVLTLFGTVYYLQPYENLLGHNKRVITSLANPADADTLNPGATNLPFGPLPNQDLRMQDPNLKPKNGILALHQSENIDMVSWVLLTLIMGLSIATSTVRQWQHTEQKVVQAEAGKARAELSFLKAQINPHFLFNTLNNIYTLSVTRNPNTSDSIMKLSNIMRYVTDEVTEDQVYLQREIECIHDYIDLQRLRLGEAATINFTVPESVGAVKIAPLILMTFTENAFKYGVSKKENIVIGIRIDVEPEAIRFMCRNKDFNTTATAGRTGIGIANTKRRLEHLYPGRHRLEITRENQLFTVELTIDR